MFVFAKFAYLANVTHTNYVVMHRSIASRVTVKQQCTRKQLDILCGKFCSIELN